MNENSEKSIDGEGEESKNISMDAILELNFVPDWARKPPGKNYFDYKHEDSKDNRRRPPMSKGRRPDKKMRPEKNTGGQGRPARSHEFKQGSTETPRHTGRQISRPYVQRHERPPVSVRILPGNKYLSEVARLIHKAKRTYPLMEVASLFLANPGSCDVRLEIDPSANDSVLYQCKCCKMVSLSEDALLKHMIKHHMDEFLIKEEKECEPPSGQFTCVAKCGLSGLFLGPPNHHSYNVKLQETHKSRYAHMTIEEYTNHIILLHDSESIESWKESCRKQYFFRIKDGSPDAEPMIWSKAEAFFQEKIAPAQKRKTKRAILPLTVSREIEEPGLLAVVRDAWLKENRFPSYLMQALRGAFSHKGLKLFKTGGTKGITFVSPIVPAPLKLEHVIDSIKEVIVYLKDHPGCSRKELVAGLRPDTSVSDVEAKAILSPLGWLIERGHIIEFYNGTLSVPLK